VFCWLNSRTSYSTGSNVIKLCALRGGGYWPSGEIKIVRVVDRGFHFRSIGSSFDYVVQVNDIIRQLVEILFNVP